MTSMDQDKLIRLVAAEGKLAIDPERKLEGRGAYICDNPSCIKKAIKKNAFRRVLNLEITEEEIQMLEEGIKGARDE